MERYDSEISHTVQLQMGFFRADVGVCDCGARWEGDKALKAGLDHQLAHLRIRQAREVALKALEDRKVRAEMGRKVKRKKKTSSSS